MSEEAGEYKFKRNSGHGLADELLQSFTEAYRWRVKGRSLDAILIYHDIIAAASDFPDVIVNAHRCAIRSACEAFDAGVPFNAARSIMWIRLHSQVETLLNEDKVEKLAIGQN
jgi:hypothetical protein